MPTGKIRVRASSIRQVITLGAAGATFTSSDLSITARSSAAKGSSLPATGSSSPSTLLPIALLMIPAGVAAVAMSRRRRAI
jgi:hypothetical protein